LIYPISIGNKEMNIHESHYQAHALKVNVDESLTPEITPLDIVSKKESTSTPNISLKPPVQEQ
jgi:bifunctional DNase/RNase